MQNQHFIFRFSGGLTWSDWTCTRTLYSGWPGSRWAEPRDGDLVVSLPTTALPNGVRTDPIRSQRAERDETHWDSLIPLDQLPPIQLGESHC